MMRTGLVLAIAILAAATAMSVTLNRGSELGALAMRLDALEHDTYWKRPYTWRHKDALSTLADALDRAASLADKARLRGEALAPVDPVLIPGSAWNALEEIAGLLQLEGSTSAWPQRYSDRPPFTIDIKELLSMIVMGAITTDEQARELLLLNAALRAGDLSKAHSHFMRLHAEYYGR